MATIALAGKFKIFNVTLQRSPLTLLHRFEPCRPLFDASNPFSLNLYARGVTSEGNASLALCRPSLRVDLDVCHSVPPPSFCLPVIPAGFLSNTCFPLQLCSYLCDCLKYLFPIRL